MPPLPAADVREPQAPAPAEEGSDPRLVAAARSGDRAAFARLYDRYAPIAHAALLESFAPADAEDLVQDVFLTIWRRLDSLHEPRAFCGWMLAIARHAAADRRRAARPLRPLESAPEPACGAAGGDGQRVLDAIRTLPEPYRLPLLLRLVEGLSGPQIAARTGLTHGSVRVNLCRGMEMLRRKLGEP
jgi:RNA polymerase sigma-70 factor (ECF subfamily)